MDSKTVFYADADVVVRALRREDAPVICREERLQGWHPKEIGYETVSYTHLDVYKRQAHGRELDVQKGQVIMHIILPMEQKLFRRAKAANYSLDSGFVRPTVDHGDEQFHLPGLIFANCNTHVLHLKDNVSHGFAL